MAELQATEVFSKPDFLARFAKTWLNINYNEQAIKDDQEALETSIQVAQQTKEEQERQKQEEAERAARQKELEEKYKNLSDAEIQSEIARINNQIFDMNEKYRKIIEFQKIIAKTRGLISEKESMELADIAFLPYATEEIPSIIDILNQNNIFSTAMLGVDDTKKTSVLLVSKADKYTTANIIKKFTEESTKGYSEKLGEKYLGKLTPNVLARLPLEARRYFGLHRFDNNRFSVFASSSYSYNKKCENLLSELYQAIQSIESIQSMNGDETIKQKIKFYIQLPIQRSMLPVIEQLKQVGIEFYIPPIDIPGFDFKKSEPTYRIYIDRQYLDQYKYKVHPILSEGGVVLIGDEQVNVADLILSNCEFPYGLDKQKEL